MLQQSRAWLLKADVDFAVAERHMVEYLLSPKIIDVPLGTVMSRLARGRLLLQRALLASMNKGLPL